MPAPPIPPARLYIPYKLLVYHCGTNAVSYKTSSGRGGWVPLSWCLQQERSWFLSCPQKKKFVLTQRAWSLSHLPALLIYQPSPQGEVNTKGGKQRAAWGTQSLQVLLQGCILLPLCNAAFISPATLICLQSLKSVMALLMLFCTRIIWTSQHLLQELWVLALDLE